MASNLEAVMGGWIDRLKGGMINPVRAGQINVVYCQTVELLGTRIKRQGTIYQERWYAVYL